WKNEDTGLATTAMQEAVLIIALIGLPYIGYAFLRIMHTGLFGRCVFPTICGMTLAVGIVLARFSRRALFLVGLVIVMAVSVLEIHFWHHAAENREGVVTAPQKLESLFWRAVTENYQWSYRVGIFSEWRGRDSRSSTADLFT